MNESRDDRPPMIVAMEWTSRVTTIALEMALPPLGGYWLDHRLDTRPLFVIIGAVFGMTAGMYHLIRMTKLHR